MREDKQLLSIGEASRITGMHVKSLRYYDRIGVFKPKHVDEYSGYRYYTFEQLQKIIAVRTCLDTGIVLSELDNYLSEDTVDYSGLFDDARNNIERQIALLEKKRQYLDFLGAEVSFNDKKSENNAADECFGSIALWTMPFEGDMETFSRKDELIRLASEANKSGYQISPLYFGTMLKCTGDDRQLYVFAGIENFLHVEEADNAHIQITPCGWYRRAFSPDLDVTRAEDFFPELFAQEYDKTVLATISLHGSYADPMYSMFINLPPEA